jgi:N-acetylneuraminate synthase
MIKIIDIPHHNLSESIDWFASVWDLESLDFIDQYDVPYIKIPSAMLTNHKLLKAARTTGRTIVMSSGMSTMQEIEDAVDVVGEGNLILMHCTSAYPCDPSELNLSMIHTLKELRI